jgi:hypothetical protein
VAREPASWVDLIHKAVHTSDDHDIGNIEAVSPNFAVVKRGLVHVLRYYIPLGKVEGWDGRVVWLKIPEEQVNRDYERKVAPDPFVYHYSSEPLADGSVRDFSINMPVIEPPYEEEKNELSGSSAKASNKEQLRFLCDLCGMTFGSEEELSNHVASKH